MSTNLVVSPVLVALVAFAVLACSSSKDEEPGKISLGGLAGACQAGDDQHCARDFETEPWSCSCGSRRETSNAAACEQALAQACEVQAAVCMLPEVGVCTADETSSGYACECGDVSLTVEGASCMDTLSATCTPACEAAGIASCYSRGPDAGFSCACSLYGGVQLSSDASQCQVAAQVCEPGEAFGEGWCKSFSGVCTSHGDGFECQCTDGTDGLSSATASCREALDCLCSGENPEENPACAT